MILYRRAHGCCVQLSGRFGESLYSWLGVVWAGGQAKRKSVQSRGRLEGGETGRIWVRTCMQGWYMTVVVEGVYPIATVGLSKMWGKRRGREPDITGERTGAYKTTSTTAGSKVLPNPRLAISFPISFPGDGQKRQSFLFFSPSKAGTCG